MDGESPTGDAQPEWRSAMIDVSGMSLAELSAAPGAAGSGESALARALRRVADGVTGDREPIAG
ncbi:MAG TPA: FxSxx-COOH cyclophane-containing RiPP peptide, partial [Actinoplanes sp.]|nr:FxSxx-COOH cyclophane-containing RiPP peptide [Actinoplanes sp.]